MTLDEYTVDFDMKYSHTVHVKAKNKPEAKRKAFKEVQEDLQQTISV